MFIDRTHAGQLLADELQAYAEQPDTIVLGLPRGGVPVACEVAKTLHLPLDIFLVRKLGVPGRRELAMGAIALGKVTYLNREIIHSLHISKSAIAEVKKQERKELERRNTKYRGDQPAPQLESKTVILVDDGIATGATMHAAINAIKQQKPKKIIVATPGIAPSMCYEFEKRVDEVICAYKSESKFAVSQWYQSFPQIEDEEVCEILKKSVL